MIQAWALIRLSVNPPSKKKKTKAPSYQLYDVSKMVLIKLSEAPSITNSNTFKANCEGLDLRSKNLISIKATNSTERIWESLKNGVKRRVT